MKIKFRTAFWVGAAVLMAVLLALAFRPRAVAVDVTRTARGPLTVAVRDEGRTRVRNEYLVSAPVAGRLLRVPHKAGDHVHAAQTVAHILPADPSFIDVRTRSELEAAVQSAEAALAVVRADAERAAAEEAFAHADAERMTTVFAQGLTSRDSLDRAQLQLRVAEASLRTARESVRMQEAELDAARVRLSQPGGQSNPGSVVEVRAPVSGRVLRVTQESESVIAAGAEIMSIGDPADLEIVAELLSTDAAEVLPGAAVQIENWSRSMAPLRGRVRLVEPYGFLKISALGVEEQRVNVIVDFVDPPSERSMLGHGFRVEAAITTWETEDAMLVPVAALFRDGDQWAVFRVEGGRARLTPLEIGHDNGRDAEVLAGIDAGETIILFPGAQVRDGVRVIERGP